MSTTHADVKVQPMWSGIQDGVLFKIAGHDFETVKKAEFLIFKLLETVSARTSWE